MASSATKHFVMQRFTAIIQIPLVIWLVISVLRHARDSHAEIMAWVADPLTAALLILFIVSVSFHMHLGMGEVIDDYLHKKGGKSAASTANTLFSLAIGVIGLFSVIAITLIA